LNDEQERKRDKKSKYKKQMEMLSKEERAKAD
jgi:hypothetical protein